MRVPRIVAVMLIGFAGAWLSFAVTARQVLDPVVPSVGLLGLVSTQARAVAAANLVVPGATDAQRRKAHDLAFSVLSREPGNVVAARTLGLEAALEGRQAAFDAWLSYGESLSRRDSTTQLALIESNVAAGDVAGALRHYNRVMLTNVSSRDTLLPVLLPAVNDIVVARALVPFLRRRPAWWPHFIGALAGGGTNPAAIRLLMEALRLDTQNPSEAAALGGGLARMIALGEEANAFEFYHSLRKSTPKLIRDGSFDQVDAFGPFEWSLSDDDGGAASRQERTDGLGLALFVVAGDFPRDVAEQTLMLAPGTYVLSGRLVAESSNAPAMAMRIKCLKSKAELTRITSAMPSIANGLRQAEFVVPPDCTLAEIVIGVDAASEGQAAGWVDDIVLARR